MCAWVVCGEGMCVGRRTCDFPSNPAVAIPRQINDEDVLINVGPRSTKSRSHRQCNVLSSQRSNSASHVGVFDLGLL